MDSLHRLEELFAHFPGIGPRQARRFVYYLLGKSPASIAEFIKLIEEVKKATSECPQCHRLFVNSSKQIICSVCADPSRDPGTLMIVARDSDFESVEKSGVYKGLYFILGGTVPILDKEPEKRIRLRALLERVEKDCGRQSQRGARPLGVGQSLRAGAARPGAGQAGVCQVVGTGSGKPAGGGRPRLAQLELTAPHGRFSFPRHPRTDSRGQ